MEEVEARHKTLKQIECSYYSEECRPIIEFNSITQRNDVVPLFRLLLRCRIHHPLRHCLCLQVLPCTFGYVDRQCIIYDWLLVNRKCSLTGCASRVAPLRDPGFRRSINVQLHTFILSPWRNVCEKYIIVGYVFMKTQKRHTVKCVLLPKHHLAEKANVAQYAHPNKLNSLY